MPVVGSWVFLVLVGAYNLGDPEKGVAGAVVVGRRQEAVEDGVEEVPHLFCARLPSGREALG